MLRIGDHQVTRAPQLEIAEVMQCPLALLVPIGRVTTTRTRVARVVATVQDHLGLRQVCNGCDPFGGIGAILTWTEHG